MNKQELIERYLPLLKQNILPAGLTLLGLMLLSIGVIQFLGPKDEEIEFVKGEETASETVKTEKEIAVDISGEVIAPGVYKLSLGSRIQDVLIKAQGLSSNADREYVSRYVNLAQKVTDGMKIYIPKASGGSGVLSGESNGSNWSNGSNLSKIININLASIGELDKLPGVGEVTAEKIINGRPYGTVEELLEKKIVSASVFEKIKEIVSVY